MMDIVDGLILVLLVVVFIHNLRVSRKTANFQTAVQEMVRTMETFSDNVDRMEKVSASMSRYGRDRGRGESSAHPAAFYDIANREKRA